MNEYTWAVYNGKYNERYLIKGNVYKIIVNNEYDISMLKVYISDKWHSWYSINQFYILKQEEQELINLIYS